MNIDEYNKVKNLTYLQYCDYLQDKYGIGLSDYMTKSYNPNPKCKRTKDGLIAHHKMENTMIMLSTKQIAELSPFEWQKKENIVYCDYLEHLLLHVLICKYPADNGDTSVGIGGVINFIAPELNDLYSGWNTNQQWRKICHDKVINDKSVYFEILKQFLKITNEKFEQFDIELLCRSFGERHGTWNGENNSEIYKQIRDLRKEV